MRKLPRIALPGMAASRRRRLASIRTAKTVEWGMIRSSTTLVVEANMRPPTRYAPNKETLSLDKRNFALTLIVRHPEILTAILNQSIFTNTTFIC